VWCPTGWVLSPVLFTVYVDDVIKALSNSGRGCYFANVFMGCIMYADDMLLLSASLCDLQAVIDICVIELAKLEVSLNVSKSEVLRIGRT